MRVKLKSDAFNFSLMDDTGQVEYPLLNLNVNKIEMLMSWENGPDDPANYILKKMGISKIPFMDLKAGMHLESSYYNIDAGCYEPLVEPWLVNL